MKKILALCLTAVLCLTFFASCTTKEHEHISEWKYNELTHWQSVTCTTNECDFNMPAPERHVDENKDGVCDVCEYLLPNNFSEIAQIVLDYEQGVRDEIDTLHAENPEYNYYYNPVDKVYCYFVLDGEVTADAIVQKYDMKNLFVGAKVSALNAIKMIGITFERNEFTEDAHLKIKQISEAEAHIENLFVEMERVWYRSYMPKIEYYTDEESILIYEDAHYVVKVGRGKDIILKTKADYDAYLDELLEDADDYEKERITNARGKYDESFFEENALIFTRMIVRGSGSIKLTVNNLYISGNKIYVVIRTDVPTQGDDAMQYAFFGFAVEKSAVANVNEVITLE